MTVPIPFLRLLNTGTTLGILTLNALAVKGLLYGTTPARISSAFPTLITPAGFTFSIWSVIFVLLIAFTIAQFIPSISVLHRRALIRAVGGWYFAVFACMVFWTLVWHQYQVGLALFFIAGLLLSLAVLFARLWQVRKQLAQTYLYGVSYVAFSLFLGWASVAFTLNVSVWLVSIEWDQWSVTSGSWAAGALTLLFLVTYLFVEHHKALAFAAAVLWALLGIYVQQNLLGHKSIVVQGVCVVAATLLLVRVGLVVFHLLRSTKEHSNDTNTSY